MKRPSDPRMTREASDPSGQGDRPTNRRPAGDAPRGDRREGGARKAPSGAGRQGSARPTGEGRREGARSEGARTPGPARGAGAGRRDTAPKPKPKTAKKGAGHGNRKGAGNNANKNHAAKSAGPAREGRGRGKPAGGRAIARGNGRVREAGPSDRRETGARGRSRVGDRPVREDRPVQSVEVERPSRVSEEIGAPPERGTTRREMAAASAARSGNAPTEPRVSKPASAPRTAPRPKAGARVSKSGPDGRGKVGSRATKPAGKPASGLRPARTKSSTGGNTLRTTQARTSAKVTARKLDKVSARSKVLARSLANPGPSARASRAVSARVAERNAPIAAPSKVGAEIEDDLDDELDGLEALHDERDDDIDDGDDLDDIDDGDDTDDDSDNDADDGVDPDAGKPGRAERLRSTEARLLAAADAAQAAEHAAASRSTRTPSRAVKPDASRPPRVRAESPAEAPRPPRVRAEIPAPVSVPRSDTPDVTSDLGDEFFDPLPGKTAAPAVTPNAARAPRDRADGSASPRREAKPESKPTSKPAKPTSKPAKPAKTPERLAPARVRLQKVLASAGIAARRKAEDLITGRRVTVNGRIVSELGAKVDPERDEIKVNGKIVQVEKKVYFVLNKPDGVVCSAEGLKDGEGRPTVLSLLPLVTQRVYPVGRLDFHSRGVLILTNDGDLSAALTHPRHKVAKTYHVKFQGRLDEEALAALGRGITLEDGTVTKPAEEVSIVKETSTNTWVQITIRQGLNRQIRRMGDAMGHPVLKLIRVAVGAVTADGLADGEFRPLTPTEVYDLMAAALS